MPALVAGIHVFGSSLSKTWMAGTSPAMTCHEKCLTSANPANNPPIDSATDAST
jgi:hypothetical protein